VSCSARGALCPIDAQAHLLAPSDHPTGGVRRGVGLCCPRTPLGTSDRGVPLRLLAQVPDRQQKGVMGELARLLH